MTDSTEQVARRILNAITESITEDHPFDVTEITMRGPADHVTIMGRTDTPGIGGIKIIVQPDVVKDFTGYRFTDTGRIQATIAGDGFKNRLYRPAEWSDNNAAKAAEFYLKQVTIAVKAALHRAERKARKDAALNDALMAIAESDRLSKIITVSAGHINFHEGGKQARLLPVLKEDGAELYLKMESESRGDASAIVEALLAFFGGDDA